MSLQAELLETSFAQVRDRQADFTTYFYATLFADYPQIKPLFAHIQMEQQAQKLFASLVLVVDNLKQADVLTQALKGLGTRHVKYGVLPEHYPLIGSSLLKALKFCLAADWTPELETAWTEAYAAVAQLMLDGANYPPAVLYPAIASRSAV